MNNQLFNAVYYNNLLNVQQLVLNGVDVNCRDNYGVLLLFRADTLEIVQFLVWNGADVNCRCNNGSTLLHYVRSLEIAQFLVLNGVDVNCQNNDGSTPLYYVNCVITKFLVVNGADVNHQNNCGNTPLHACATIHNYYGCIKNIKILLEYGADMHIKNNVGISAYDCAIQSNINELIELFEHYNAISNGLEIKEPCVE